MVPLFPIYDHNTHNIRKCIYDQHKWPKARERPITRQCNMKYLFNYGLPKRQIE